jgi:sugar/nucleoside kinase (ribokinase family)
LAIDLITSPEIASSKPTLGGPPTYVSLAAVKLGAKASIVSKVGQDFPEDYVKWLGANHVDLSGLKRVEDAVTTRFVLRYQGNWKRKLQLKALAPPLLTNDVPNSLQAKAIHIAPIVNELSETRSQKCGNQPAFCLLIRRGLFAVSILKETCVLSFGEKSQC